MKKYYGSLTKRSASFNGASTSRLYFDWTATLKSSDAKIRRELVLLRVRSRDLCDKDDYARKFVTLSKTNVIGPNGITLNMDVRDIGGTQDTFACNLIENAWAEFSKPEYYTASGDLDRVTASNLLWGTGVRDGEILFRKVLGADNPFGFTIQLIEPDYLDEAKNEVLPNGNFIKMGVEFEPVYRKRVAYWLRYYHPGDDFMVTKNYKSTTESQRVPADQIVHRFLPEYIEQSRGLPMMFTAMTRLKMLGGYEEAALVGARIGASKMGFLERTAASAGAEYTPDDEEEDGEQITEVEPGIFEQLPFGMQVKTVDWNNPSDQFAPFSKAMLRGIASGLGVSYNSLASDLEGVNYSSIRAGLLEERDLWKLLQNWWIAQVESQIFTEWLRMSLTTGAIPLPLSKFSKFNAPIFSGRRWAWVDPEKDINAACTAIDRGITPRQRIKAEMTGDGLEDDYILFKADKDLQAKYGLDFSAPEAKAKAAETAPKNSVNPKS